MICEDFNLYIVRRFYIHYTNHDKESIHDVVGVVVESYTECIYSYRRKTRRAFNVDHVAVGDTTVLHKRQERVPDHPTLDRTSYRTSAERPKNVSAIRLSENGYTARIF
jgi:hypothetical protein